MDVEPGCQGRKIWNLFAYKKQVDKKQQDPKLFMHVGHWGFLNSITEVVLNISVGKKSV